MWRYFSGRKPLLRNTFPHREFRTAAADPLVCPSPRNPAAECRIETRCTNPVARRRSLFSAPFSPCGEKDVEDEGVFRTFCLRIGEDPRISKG